MVRYVLPRVPGGNGGLEHRPITARILPHRTFSPTKSSAPSHSRNDGSAELICAIAAAPPPTKPPQRAIHPPDSSTPQFPLMIFLAFHRLPSPVEHKLRRPGYFTATNFGEPLPTASEARDWVKILDVIL
jgi:hypothetical protein